MVLRTQVLMDWASFYSLESEWNKLLINSRADTIFLTWEWIHSWSIILKEPVKPFIVVVRDSDNVLVGIAPFYLTYIRLLGVIKYKTLRIMADLNTGSEYPGWIALKESEISVYQHIVKVLCQYHKYWECIWMPRCAGWTTNTHNLIGICKDSRLYYKIRNSSFSVVELPDRYDAYIKSLSSNRRSQLNRQLKKILGKPDVTVTYCKDLNVLPHFLEALFDLHYRRWQTKGELGTFKRRPSQLLFNREFTKHALQKGWLCLFGLKDSGEFKAIQLGYCYNGSYHQLQEGFEPAYISGVGNVLRAKVIEACISNHVEKYDFLGGMTEHKRSWLAQGRAGYDLLIGDPSLKNAILFKTKLWPTGRFCEAPK